MEGNDLLKNELPGVIEQRDGKNLGTTEKLSMIVGYRSTLAQAIEHGWESSLVENQTKGDFPEPRENRWLGGREDTKAVLQLGS